MQARVSMMAIYSETSLARLDLQAVGNADRSSLLSFQCSTVSLIGFLYKSRQSRVVGILDE